MALQLNNKRICSRCVLPEYKPYINLDGQGVCNICHEYDKVKKLFKQQNLLETEFVKIVNKYKNKSEYDCLVMCSGGKDSTTSLYYAKTRYKLNPLVFTFDNGFESEQALDNVRRAVSILGVDWVYYKSDFMKDMFSEAVKHGYKAPLCTICSLWYMQCTYKTAARYNTPLIIAGWTPGQLTSKPSRDEQEDNLEFKILCEEIARFIDIVKQKYPKYKNFSKNMEEVKKSYNISKKTIVLSPHWFLPLDPEDYKSIITKELGWKQINVSYPEDSTNCFLNLVGSYLSISKYGFTHFHVEMSKLIRRGQLTREKALKRLSLNIEQEPVASKVDNVLAQLNCSRAEL